MTTRTRTRNKAPPPATPQRYTVTADVYLCLETVADTPEEALAAYQALRLARPELHGRGGITVLLPADLPAVVTADNGREVLRVKAVGVTTGKNASRFNPGQLKGGDGQPPKLARYLASRTQ